MTKATGVSIDADVRVVARQFGLDPRLLQAVVRSEGDILRAVQCSIPSVKTRHDALVITARSAVHAMSDYLKTHTAPEFVAFWGARWAPEGAKNDPTHLNANWPVNVLRLWTGTTK